VRFGGESIGGGRAIRIKERFRGDMEVQRWAGRMRGLVGDDGLVTAVNRREHMSKALVFGIGGVLFSAFMAQERHVRSRSRSGR